MEAAALKWASGTVVANFIIDNVIYNFDIPKRILSDYDTPFLIPMRDDCARYVVEHVKSCPYYPQGNGQAEATNKTLIRILIKMAYEEPKWWIDFLSIVLWAYLTSKRTLAQATPFSLIYEVMPMVPIKVMVPSTHLALASQLSDPHGRIYDVEALEEMRHSVENKWLSY